MATVFVVIRNKSGLGFSSDVLDRVFFYEDSAKMYVNKMNTENRSSRRKNETMFKKEYTYRKMHVYGRAVKLEEPVAYVEATTKRFEPQPYAEKTRKKKDETQIEGVAETS